MISRYYLHPMPPQPGERAISTEFFLRNILKNIRNGHLIPLRTRKLILMLDDNVVAAFDMVKGKWKLTFNPVDIVKIERMRIKERLARRVLDE